MSRNYKCKVNEREKTRLNPSIKTPSEVTKLIKRK